MQADFYMDRIHAGYGSIGQRLCQMHMAGIIMSRRFKDLTAGDLAKLPGISADHFCIGEERIYLHLSNQKKMHWYLAEYGPINHRFFGFFEDSSDGISSGFRTYDEILRFAKKGDLWEPMVDGDWKPLAAKEIPSLQGYIKMMICPPDNM